jgi:hypothetical protein
MMHVTNIVVYKINGIPAPSTYNQRASTAWPRALGGCLPRLSWLLEVSNISTQYSCITDTNGANTFIASVNQSSAGELLISYGDWQNVSVCHNN